MPADTDPVHVMVLPLNCQLPLVAEMLPPINVAFAGKVSVTRTVGNAGPGLIKRIVYVIVSAGLGRRLLTDLVEASSRLYEAITR